MNTKRNISIGELLGGLLVLLLFVFAGYVSQNYGDQLHVIIEEGGIIGLLSYAAVTIVAVVVAPVSTLPLLPLAVTIWGVIPGAFLTIFSWTVGAMIAYSLSRKYGRPLVGRVANLEKAQQIGEFVAGKNPFWTVILLRIIVPVDILSYALGLVIDMRMRTYALATFLGITPFAFIFAYAASLPVLYQIAVIIIAAIVASVGYLKVRQAVDKLNSPR